MFQHQPRCPDATAADRMAARVAASHPGDDGPPRTRIGRAMMNRVMQYHSDHTMCADGRTCLRDDHTTVPPRCGVRTGPHATGCELCAGHPGPHLLTG
jgi:hypothetical protein